MARYPHPLIIFMGAAIGILFASMEPELRIAPSISSEADMTSWDGFIFVVQDNLLKKIDSDLKTIKTIRLVPVVPLPPEPEPVKPEPGTTPSNSEYNDLSGTEGLTTIMPSGEVYPPRVSADMRFVYVLYQGSIYVFDHNLNQIRTKILE
jgi:hypothetical protein